MNKDDDDDNGVVDGDDYDENVWIRTVKMVKISDSVVLCSI
jgi:hypothetical protein